MTLFPIHDANTASPAAGKKLNALSMQLGFIPNVFAVIAESEPALEAFVNLNNLFGDSSFDATEREIIEIATSVENQCTYCVAGHTAFAHMQGVPAETIEALRNSAPLSDARLEALNTFTRALVRNRGMVDQDEVELFIDAGYTPGHVMEVILGICVKTFSNLASNAVRIPVDAQFEEYAWQRPGQMSAPMSVVRASNY